MEELIERVADARIGETFNFYRDGWGPPGAGTAAPYLESRRDAAARR
jgi:hypothetical protein